MSALAFTEAEMARARDMVAAQPAPNRVGAAHVWPLVVEDSLGGLAPENISRASRLVAADMLARDEFGRAKYGQPLTVECGRDFLIDAYQEDLDRAVYLRAALEDPRTAPFRLTLASLYEGCQESLRAVRLMIAVRDGELP